MRYPEYAPFHFDPRALPRDLLGKPPLNEPTTIALVATYASLAASLAGGVIQYDAGKKQARQAELNAEAQNDALKIERDRQAAEHAENTRRAVMQQKRQRAQQAAALSTTGVLATTGSPLAMLADTWATQQTQLADASYLQQLSQRELAYRGSSALAQGRNEAGQIRAAAYGTALSQLGQIGNQAYGAFKTTPR